MNSTEVIKVGYSDYWDIWLKRIGDRIALKRITPLDYEYMEEYIDNNCDLLSEWQDDAYNWHTELGYDERRQNYEYRYDDWFSYDSDLDTYYDNNDNNYTYDYFYPTDHSKEDIINIVVDTFDDDYNVWNFEEEINLDSFRETVWRFYDDCIKYREELEENKKPHWSAFNYYK